ncbi:efflux RND transporter periplasmic adaptor subunit [Mesorhizobium sp. M4B.F.Ca.ET.215.01.1.1]|uniref:efflux RND transporter periplasmic adaptor subunit n=2 Tax=Mesorhizobium TaxID=68287 RepID=UPI000FCB15F0|nr:MULTISPECIES: efflux RND transporter periplasmic adaptor subunit [unclassified Mesorhizobium]RUW26301.1 efflux RND transporter periplasmic adaptor subunit [Mesorhizobium sp. M4B.F.Ca.ET.013.02.1.1]RVD39218.1 efflux RND transporter periplasmic adaptor subunit [Mesorhizobium sp. M4B.F.Ca.ET.019.03.1.1]TGQ07108.1 efflux RND transporter periplasmic adaptor subunit [Mesorhizobium sp. M4B.F.Ca.ET.215.01.1.1]TGQ34787.1 efflux RND transporter periplasmic adaptor subunit [Mesorhizobium sp. M00.F.Ca.E
MPKIRFHKLAAIVVLIGFAAWMGTGEFSSVGSAAADKPKAEDASKAAQPEAAKPKAAEAEAKAPLRTVAVVTPPRKTYARAIRISGLTEADKRAVLATRVAGVIDKLPVKQGQRVKTGDLVLMLAAEEKISNVDNAKQLLVQRQAELEAALRLMKTGNLPALQLDTARSNLTSAQSQLETAQAELDRNEVKAPFDGVIDRVPVELGSSVMQGGEVATILKLDPVIARGEVSERDLRYIKIGDEANVRLVNDQKVTGTVRYISRDASSQTRTFRVEVAIPNADGAIPAGMTAEITLSAQPTDAVMLPRSVVTLGDKGDLGIRAVGKDNKVAFYPIDLVDDTPNGLVLGGIPQDARIIVAGQELVKEGDAVKPVEADQATINKLIGEATSGTQ